ncbi:hypothetical protein BG53_09085 [Paenibacillus darwinianus]|uniref:Uncharacterized protein n=1 Tax=Paenibacillus darwinianus TaxID=1380763 RepID=A0A9W5RYP9_9BACL|nr:hypothetical protein [Paenibacillus darwinianus]EXX84695.1 hypothetical protein CH50_11135 [Paenibacillus darwinianus]EXX85186.1 hypothetical protein BG52_08975 [Paenibacillus darwinianus]EXX85249.1 hypothetical protein BG53_09085 [Paenibacillus darwinianus]
MKIELFEQMKANLAANAAKRQEEDRQRAEAAATVAAAQKHNDEVMERALAMPDEAPDDAVNAEVSKAYGALIIAKKRQELLLQRLNDSSAPATNAAQFSLQAVMGEIRNQIQDGRLLAEMQPSLDELGAIRAQYLDKLAEVLNARARINRELLQIQQDTRSMVESATGQRSDFGVMGHAHIDMDTLRKWVWIYNDLAEDTNRLLREADDAANGKPYTASVTVPDARIHKEDRPTHVTHHQTQVIGAPVQ